MVFIYLSHVVFNLTIEWTPRVLKKLCCLIWRNNIYYIVLVCVQLFSPILVIDIHPHTFVHRQTYGRERKKSKPLHLNKLLRYASLPWSVVTFLNWTYVLHQCVVRHGPKNGHPENICIKEYWIRFAKHCRFNIKII